MTVIKISPIARRNRLTMTWLASSLGLAFLLALLIEAPPYWVFALALLGLGCATVAIGKALEPAVSLQLAPKAFNFHHRRGQYQLDWQQVLRIDQPCAPFPSNKPLNYVGIRLREPDHFYQTIAPRLALALLLEQRGLVALVSPEECGCHSLLPDQPPNAKLTGVRAAYAKQQLLLRQHLGYDLYLPHHCLDRSLLEFITLMNQYRNQAARL